MEANVGVGSAASLVKIPPGTEVGNYTLEAVLGSGSYGQVYKGVNPVTGESVAVKLESPDTRPHLEDEAKMYQALEGGVEVGIPRVHWFGHHKQHNVLVMDLLGHSLESLLNMQNRKLSLKTVLMIADQTLTATEYMHNRYIIHRDVKPANFVVGAGSLRHQIFYVDFGLAKYYMDPKTLEHIPYKEGKSLTGTARYASIATHAGVEQSRRDDLESLGYIYVYLLTGSLPWQGLQRPKAKTKKEKYQKIHDSKAMTTPESLCAGFPGELAVFLRYVKSLRFEETPDYAYLKQLFRGLYKRLGYPYDGRFDWSDGVSDTSTATSSEGRGAIGSTLNGEYYSDHSATRDNSGNDNSEEYSEEAS